MAQSKLSEERSIELLSGLPDWKNEDDVISKTYIFENFIQSLEFVNQLAETAEEIQHHPDIDIRYNKVKVALTTHDAGGLTESDFNLANVSEELAAAVKAGPTA
jgi:4a-hydroxytetrahydrobiopterin dehydratase